MLTVLKAFPTTNRRFIPGMTITPETDGIEPGLLDRMIELGFVADDTKKETPVSEIKIVEEKPAVETEHVVEKAPDEHAKETVTTEKTTETEHSEAEKPAADPAT